MSEKIDDSELRVCIVNARLDMDEATEQIPAEIADTIKWLDKQFAAIRCDGGGWIAFCADAGNAYPALRDEIARLRKIEAAAEEWSYCSGTAGAEKLLAALAGEGGGK